MKFNHKSGFQNINQLATPDLCSFFNRKNIFHLLMMYIIWFSGIVSLALNLKIDRVYEKKMSWSNALKDQDSDEFQQLSWEVVRAVSQFFLICLFFDVKTVFGLQCTLMSQMNLFVNNFRLYEVFLLLSNDKY
jgi:hypothetical protein